MLKFLNSKVGQERKKKKKEEEANFKTNFNQTKFKLKPVTK